MDEEVQQADGTTVTTALDHRLRWYERQALALDSLGFGHLANPHSLRAALKKRQGRVIAGVGLGGMFLMDYMIRRYLDHPRPDRHAH